MYFASFFGWGYLSSIISHDQNTSIFKIYQFIKREEKHWFLVSSCMMAYRKIPGELINHVTFKKRKKSFKEDRQSSTDT